jgi:hypothetical protein
MTTRYTNGYHAQILDILTEDGTLMPNRTELARRMGIDRDTLYNNFTGEELTEVYNEALDIRRKQLAGKSVEVDRALLKAALAGDTHAIKLYYQRHEGWSPTTKIEGDITHMTLAERLMQIEKGEAAAGTSTPSLPQIEDTKLGDDHVAPTSDTEVS